MTSSDIQGRNPFWRCTLAAAISVALAPAVYAQEEPEDLEEVVVTGSRIARAGVDTFYPAISVGIEEIEDGAFTNIADVLNEIPSFGNADATPFGAQNGFSVGQNFVDFYGLGSQRTLTLVNGRRFVSANTPSVFGESGGLQVDFNVIPVALVERIETIGVGGAPIYGSDAIAGTINVITKDRFEGVEITARKGLAEEGDADNSVFSLVAGANFSDGRGNVTLSMETFQQDGLLRNERPRFTENDPYFATEQRRFPDDPNNDQSVRRINRDQRVNIFTTGGAVSPIPQFIPTLGAGAFGDGNFYQFDSNSNLVPYIPGERPPGSVFFANGGSGPDFFDNVAQIQSPLDRDVFSAQLNFDLTSDVSLEADVLFANTVATELVNQGGFNTFAFGNDSGALLFPSDHPFLSDQARGLLSDLGADNFFVNRFNNDIIDSSNKREQFLWHATAGLKGSFDVGARSFNWSVSAGHGKSDGETFNEGIIDGRFLNALDVRVLTEEDLAAVDEQDILSFSGTSTAGVGDFVCESVYQAALGNANPESGFGVTDGELPFVDGCVPLNIFGEGARSDAAREWVTGDAQTLSDIQQSVFNVNFGGNLFDLPGGPVGFNIGYETRQEQALFSPGLGAEVGLTRSAPFIETGGEYDTDELYAEFVIPIIGSGNSLPFLQFAEISGAVREIDNSQAGSGTVWTTGLRFAPVDDIAFRANYTESLRAPSLVELFAPQSQQFSFADDPCDFRFVNEGPAPATRRSNCQTALGAGYDPDTFTSNVVNATAVGLTGGNPELINETAESFAVGLSFEPRWVDNLVLTADYVSIELTDAIQSLTLEQLMESCFDSSGFPASSCSSFSRDANGQIIDFLTGQANAALFEYETLDFGINYEFELASAFGWNSWGDADLGDMSTRLRFQHPLERRISVVGEPTDPTIGGFTDPDWSGTFDFTWSRNDLRVFWRVLWQDDAALDPAGDDLFEDLNGNLIGKSDARFLNNATVSYSVGNLFSGAPSDTTIQLAIGNVFDHKPDLIQEAAGHFGTAELLGRNYTFTIQGSY